MLYFYLSAMEELIVELQLFLQLLDHEYLTSTVREKKAVLNNILLRIQATKGQGHSHTVYIHDALKQHAETERKQSKSSPLPSDIVFLYLCKTP